MTKHFFDVGANIGQTVNWLIEQPEYNGCKLWCFEPSPRHWHSLLKMAQEYGDRYKIVLCPFGLHAYTATALWHPKVDPEGDSLYETLTVNGKEIVDAEAGYTLMAQMVDVVKFINEYTKPDDHVTLKLDCEGSEWGILSRLLDTRSVKEIDRILVEWHSIPGIDFHHERARLMDAYAGLGVPLENWI